MEIEYEARVLEIDKEKLIQKLEKLGAIFKGSFEQKRYVYNIIPKCDGKWLRLRTNGKNITLTYKSIEKNSIDGTQELEIEVEDFEKTNKLLELAGIKNKGYQENRRVQYVLDGVEIDIDTWPLIPTYVEIEGKDKESVVNMIKKLEIEDKKITTLDVQSVYKDIYNIDITKMNILKF